METFRVSRRQPPRAELEPLDLLSLPSPPPHLPTLRLQSLIMLRLSLLWPWPSLLSTSHTHEAASPGEDDLAADAKLSAGHSSVGHPEDQRAELVRMLASSLFGTSLFSSSSTSSRSNVESTDSTRIAVLRAGVACQRAKRTQLSLENTTRTA